MRLGIGLEPQHLSSGTRLSRWADLSRLCCQAAGGDPEWADNLAAAWLLYYSAAHLMDKVQDQDEPDPWWKDRGPAVALTTATGLFFSASLSLNQIGRCFEEINTAVDICEDFNRNLLVMASGQYSQFNHPPQCLDQYWQQAIAKSGLFFALACRNGARLATTDTGILDHFNSFGKHLGLLVQIVDDLDDVLPVPGSLEAGQRKGLRYSLPAVYALTVTEGEDQLKLKSLFDLENMDPVSARKVIDLMDEAGASTYTLFELNRIAHLAHLSLCQAAKPSAARDQLEHLVDGLVVSHPTS
jgi:geranylgeranyl pyrophosphate synthase